VRTNFATIVARAARRRSRRTPCTSLKCYQRSRHALRAALALAAASLLGVGGAAFAHSPGAAPTYALTKADFGVAPGAGFFLNNPELTRALDDFKALRVHWIRSSFEWKNFEPSNPATLPAGASKWNWKGVDAFISTMRSPAYNGLFGLIVTIESPPTWATVASHIAPDACRQRPPFDLRSYADAAAALAQHLRGIAGVFELQNSPNLGLTGAASGGTATSWPVPDPCGYASLLKLTYPAIRAVRPDAKVLVGGIGGTKDVPKQRIAADEFLAGLYANGAKGSFDGVSFHPYSTPNLPCAPSAPVCTFDPSTSGKDAYGMSNGWDRMLNARNIMVANGDGAKPIWITEFGAPTNGPARSAAVLTEAQQATLLAAGFDRASQYPWVAEMCWFTYQDTPGANPVTSPHGDWMGLVHANYTHKTSFAIYQYLTASAH
jgi:hypothetical protein